VKVYADAFLLPTVGGAGMNETAFLEHLEDIATRLGVELRYENLGHPGIKTSGGYCKVAGKPMILINRRDSRRRKINTLARALSKLNIDAIFIPPAIRKIIETQSN
jgi:hypothetical protein